MTLTITGCGNLKNFFLNRLIVVLLVTLGGCSIVKPNPRDKDIDIILYHPNMAVGALQDIAAKDACAPGPGSGLGSLMSTCTLQTGIQFTDVTFSNQNVLKYLGNGVIKAISPGKSKLTVTAKHQYTAVTKTFYIEVFTADRFALKINGQFVQEMPFICNNKTYLAGATYFSDYQLWAGNTELGGYEFYPPHVIQRANYFFKRTHVLLCV